MYFVLLLLCRIFVKAFSLIDPCTVVINCRLYFFSICRSSKAEWLRAVDSHQQNVGLCQCHVGSVPAVSRMVQSERPSSQNYFLLLAESRVMMLHVDIWPSNVPLLGAILVNTFRALFAVYTVSRTYLSIIIMMMMITTGAFVFIPTYSSCYSAIQRRFIARRFSSDDHPDLCPIQTSFCFFNFPTLVFMRV